MLRNVFVCAALAALIAHGTLSVIFRQSPSFTEHGLVIVQFSDDPSRLTNLTIGIWGSCIGFEHSINCIKFDDALSAAESRNSTVMVIQKASHLSLGRLSDVAMILTACAITMCCGLLFTRTVTFWAKIGVFFSLMLSAVPTVVAIGLLGTFISDIKGLGLSVEPSYGVAYGWALLGTVTFALVCMTIALMYNFT